MRSPWELYGVMDKPRKNPEQDITRHLGSGLPVMAMDSTLRPPLQVPFGLSQHVSINVPICPQFMLAACLLRGECRAKLSSRKQIPDSGFYQPAGPLITAPGAHPHSPGGPPTSGVRDSGPAGGTGGPGGVGPVGGGTVGGGSDGDATKVSPNSPAASAGVRDDSENESQAPPVASATSSAAAVAAAAAAAAAVAAAAAAADQQASATAGFRYTTTASATYGSPSAHQHLHPGPGPAPPPYPYGYAPSQFYPPIPPATAGGIQYPPGAAHYHPQEICYPSNYPYGYRRYPAPPLYDMYQGPGGGGSAPPPAGRGTSSPPPAPPPPSVVQSSSSVQSSQMVVSTGAPPPPPAPLEHPYPGPAGQFYPGYSSAHPHYYPPYRCPCPIQSCPKNVHTGPLTGDASKGPTKHQPLPPVVLALPLEPAGALGPPSPARGSAGLPAPPSPAPGATNAAFHGWDGVLAKSDPEGMNFALKQDPATDIGLLTIGKLSDDKRPRKRPRNGVLEDPWTHNGTVCADLDLKPKSLKQETTDTKIIQMECPPKEVPPTPQQEVPQVEPCPPEAPAKRSVPADATTVTTVAKKQKKVPEAAASVEAADKNKSRNATEEQKKASSKAVAKTQPKTKPKSKVKSASLPPPVVNGNGAPGTKGRRSKSQENTPTAKSKTEEKSKAKPTATGRGRRSSKNRLDPAAEEAAAAAVVAAAKLPESIPRSQCRKLIANQKKLISRCQANKSKSEAKAKLAAEAVLPVSNSAAVVATPNAAPAAAAVVASPGVKVLDDPRAIAPAAVKTPKWSNGWSWQGEPFVAKVYLNSDDQPVERKCYSSMLHCEGDVVIPGDSVLLKSGTRKIDLPFVARVASLWENPEDGEMMVSLLWFYRPEHTEQGRRPEDTEDEIFASRHKDINSVACIEDKCYVLTYNEYCRYRKTVRRLEQGLAPPPLVVPPPVGGYPRLHKQPPGHVAPDMVFFCRRIYDFRQRRIQKSLS